MAEYTLHSYLCHDCGGSCKEMKSQSWT